MIPCNTAGSEDLLYDVCSIWAEQMLTAIMKHERPAYLPRREHLTRVCCLLCKRAEYEKALGLATVMPHMPAQHAAEHARIVFEAARAAGIELGTGSLRTIMARCLLAGTPAFLKYCHQVCVYALGYCVYGMWLDATAIVQTVVES